MSLPLDELTARSVVPRMSSILSRAVLLLIVAAASDNILLLGIASV